MTAQSYSELELGENFYRLKDMAIVVRNVSKGLAEVTGTGKVQPIHQSVSDWLFAEGLSILQSPLPGHVPGNAHFQISRSCIKYLLLREIQGTTADEIVHNRRNTSAFNLTKYAHSFWLSHISETEEYAVPQNDLLELLPWRTNNAYLPPSFQPQAKYVGTDSPHWDNYLHSPQFYAVQYFWDRYYPTTETKYEYDRSRSGYVRSRSGQFIQWEPDTVVEWKNCWSSELIPWKLVHALALAGVVSVLKRIHRQLPTIYDTSTGDGAEILLRAFFGINYEAIQEILSALKPQPLHQEHFRLSPLYLATMMDRDDLVRDLLSHGAEVDFLHELLGGEKITALHAALLHQKKKALRALVAGGADIDARCHYVAGLGRCSPLHLAALNSRKEHMSILLETYLELQTSNHRLGYQRQVDPLDDDGRTPLWYASARGYTEMMELLLSHRADPTVYDCRGWDCLEAFLRDSDLKYGVDLLSNWTDEAGYTILMRRISNCSLKCLSDDFPDLLLDVARSNLHNLNYQAKDGNTLLSLAASYKLEHIVEILLKPEFHVDPNTPDNEGKTALMKAAELGWDVIIDLLLNCKRTKAVLADGWTPEEDSSTEDEMV